MIKLSHLKEGYGLERSLLNVEELTRRLLSKPIMIERSVRRVLLEDATDVDKTFVSIGIILMLTENLSGTGTRHIQFFLKTWNKMKERKCHEHFLGNNAYLCRLELLKKQFMTFRIYI
jgi:hypothetical protein